MDTAVPHFSCASSRKGKGTALLSGHQTFSTFYSKHARYVCDVRYLAKFTVNDGFVAIRECVSNFCTMLDFIWMEIYFNWG